MNYQTPEIERIELDVQISLQLASVNQPPEEPDDWVQSLPEAHPAGERVYIG